MWQAGAKALSRNLICKGIEGPDLLRKPLEFGHVTLDGKLWHEIIIHINGAVSVSFSLISVL